MDCRGKYAGGSGFVCGGVPEKGIRMTYLQNDLQALCEDYLNFM